MTEIAVEILPDGCMGVASAAAYLGLSVKTLAKKRCNATGPKFVKRGRIFYFKEDLDEWLRSGRVASTSEARKVSKGKAE